MTEKIKCRYCAKRFIDASARRQHVKVVHKGKVPRKVDHSRDDDETFAERTVQAEIDRACGVENSDIDWLLPQ